MANLEKKSDQNSGQQSSKDGEIDKPVQFSEENDGAASTTEVSPDWRNNVHMLARGTSQQQNTSSFWRNEQL